ncbi:hypothetical protein EK904_005951, partial [Melospiza melodia maxima]
MCEEHEDERINIYCLRCEAPTCSLCKVFGAHKDCEVAPLPAVYQRQKERKKELLQSIAAEQEAKLQRVRGLIRQYGDHLEASSKLVEITDMSKASMSSRPEPGYENMDHFSINVDYVAEMLRTIEFQT